jgi:hypothetical protein
MKSAPRTFALLVAGFLAGSAALAADTPAERDLDRVIEHAIHDGGPFFTPSERAVIERACGYRPGEWDGFSMNDMDGVMTCTNGRRVDSPEVRAVLRTATPRITARITAAMNRPEVRAAISRVSDEAVAKAMRELANERSASE